MSIFKAYDIRGIYPEELNDEIAYRIGSAAGEFFKANVVVGRDPRISSDPIFRSFSEGITEKGLDVIDIGTIDSPGLYFAVGHYGYKAGAIITASHNPREYNGFKMCRESAIPVGGDSGLNDIKRIYTEGINKVKTEEKKERSSRRTYGRIILITF
jgi:phosphomannomutase (EC 5.4.2.8)